MCRKWTNVLLVVLIITVWQSRQFAQNKTNPVKKTKSVSVNQSLIQPKFGFGGNLSIIKMVLGIHDHSTIDQWFGLTFNYFASPQLSISANTAYGWVYPRDPEGSQFAAVSHYKTILIPFNVCGRLALINDKSVSPYLTLGLGATHWDVRDIEKVKDSIFYPGSTVYNSKVNLTFIGGLGYEVFITPSFALDFGLRYLHLLKGNEDTIGTGDDNRGIMEFHIRFMRYWNNNCDSDKDGILDKVDADPFVPEDFDGFKDTDGIPDLDNDNDGIPDRFDKMPNTPEDKDGFEDDDGIPDEDNDQDGIPDRQDKCPNFAEDYDAYQDDDGCPDPDNDNDGIADKRDKCPNYPETVNGFEDEDGCPDEKPLPPKPVEKPVVPPKIPIQLKGVNFKSGSAEMLPGSNEKLFEIGQIMLENPGIRIEIRGYTDNVGSAKANLKLSQKRADAIRQFLIDHGIAAERLRAVGFGANHPVASNLTSDGRAQNRRIECVRVD